ncbi:ribonuclease H-like domain-containing protein [Tanacetum coccineum]
MSESTKRHEENSNLIKEIRASMDVAIRNQRASIKTLEIQIGQIIKILPIRSYSEASHIDQTIPRKEKDLGNFTLPCFINNVFFDNALVDLGSSVSVMPLSTYLNLGLGELAHTKLTVELADRTVKYPKGIAKNVLVARAKDDVTKGKITLRLKMDNPNITMEEYIRLQEEKALSRGETFNWQTATYALSCAPTVNPLNDNEIDFRISFDESDDEDYMEYVPTTTEEKQDKRNEMQARETLLIALPNKDQLKFHSYKYAKLLMEAIEKRYGGNKESKKVQRTILKQQYENFAGSSQLEIQGEVITQEDMNLKLLRSLPSEWKTHALIWSNKEEIETISLDDLYNNLKIYELELTGSSNTSQFPQNVAFVSSNSTNSNCNNNTNEADNTAYGVSAAHT